MREFFLLRAEKVEDGVLRSSEDEWSPPFLFFRPIVDPFFGVENRKIGILRSSVPNIEYRRLRSLAGESE